MKSFECSFRNLNFSPSTSILLNFFFSFIDITYFFSQVKNFSTLEQSLNAKEAEAFKETSFSKARMVMRFPPKKNAGCPKAPRDFPPRKDGILYPRRVVLGLPSPSHRVCADGRTYGRTDGHVTIRAEPKFLGLIVYQISLAMERRWRALPAGSAIKTLTLRLENCKQIWTCGKCEI